MRKYQFSRFVLIDASSESSGESVHWSLRCFKMRQKPNFLIFLSRLTQAAKTQAGLCIGISSTEPSFLENAITVHCEIFQIKHWNISIKGNKNLFSEKGCYWKHTIRTPIQGLHCLPRYKDKDFKPRTQRTITKSNPERDFFSFNVSIKRFGY